MEKQRDKLIELIVNAKRADPETCSFTEFLADFMLQKITLPCPLCGEQADIVVQKDVGLIICKRCKLYKPFTIVLDGVNKARRVWNTRPAPPIGRCEECRHWEDWGACGKPDNGWDAPPMNADDFCSRFEPKGGE